MSKATIAFVSFALGVLASFVLLTASHMPTFAQVPVIIGGAGTPTVPPITSHFTDFGLSVPGGAFGVDGSECVRCTFGGAVLRYGGGNFQFTDFKFAGPVRVEFVGAARNTLLFMDFIQKLAVGQKPQEPSAPSTPMIAKAVNVKDTVTGSFGTLK
jgi:hypothetical protein